MVQENPENPDSLVFIDVADVAKVLGLVFGG
jgi:hypothetical protein